MEGPLVATSTPDGKKIILTRDAWLHIQQRHPEVGTDPNKLLRTVSDPDESYMDERGGLHALKRIDQSHFLVVIFGLTEEGRGSN